MSKGRLDINPTVLAQAAEWFAVLGSGSVSKADHAQWQAWLAAHPDNQAAWARVEFFTKKLNGLPTQAASAALSLPDIHRRQALKNLAVLAAVGFSGWGLWQSGCLRLWAADYRTGIGEIRTVTLADGTQVTLDAVSAINVDFSKNLRRLQLLQGEVYIETAPDRGSLHRPFVVESAEGRVNALGTRFKVRQQQEDSLASVFTGAIEITPADADSVRRVLQAGQEAHFTRQRVSPQNPIDSDRPGWVQGFLLADNLPLGEFVVQLNRYRHGFVTCDPEIANLRIVGSFPLNNTDRILAALEETLPVQIARPAPRWVKIEPR